MFMDNPFQRGDRVRATANHRDGRRVFYAGDTGKVVMRYPNTVVILPDGKKRTIETNNLRELEKE